LKKDFDPKTLTTSQQDPIATEPPTIPDIAENSTRLQRFSN
jgi:hypothetical protein